MGHAGDEAGNGAYWNILIFVISIILGEKQTILC